MSGSDFVSSSGKEDQRPQDVSAASPQRISRRRQSSPTGERRARVTVRQTPAAAMASASANVTGGVSHGCRVA